MCILLCSVSKSKLFTTKLGDVTVSDLTMESARVTWTVASVTEQQEYYVLYGLDENNLNYTTDRISGNANTSLTDQTYSTTIQGLTSGTLYYVQVVAEFGSTILYSETTSFRTIEPGTLLKDMHM